ncbi:transcriptional regulator [Chitinophaga agrisoli]|uniref:Transcriptional regulator n=1 Tax=Chitinophaga agrisoli TaxID=2607653 RepID=A0A5B2VW63_9BACT|nr:metalloregulator ArsR/SmtB family transcription factor [Chitinophaga agrisoli]KAA2242880.1 transcriptional regulator [Chitinophaga agrisoli]
MPKIKTAADRFLVLLKTRGPQTAASLAAELGITGEGARLQLLKLAEEGLVVAATSARGVGRPVQVWSLTAQGNAHFPDNHAELTLQLIDTIRHQLGQEALDQVISAREQQQVERYLSALEGVDGIGDKIARFAAIRTEEGFLAEWRQDEEGFLFIENHCPICSAATQCMNICQSELRTFRTILGDEVTVSRAEHIASGDHRCVYRIDFAGLLELKGE